MTTNRTKRNPMMPPPARFPPMRRTGWSPGPQRQCGGVARRLLGLALQQRVDHAGGKPWCSGEPRCRRSGPGAGNGTVGSRTVESIRCLGCAQTLQHRLDRGGCLRPGKIRKGHDIEVSNRDHRELHRRFGARCATPQAQSEIKQMTCQMKKH